MLGELPRSELNLVGGTGANLGATNLQKKRDGKGAGLGAQRATARSSSSLVDKSGTGGGRVEGKGGSTGNSEGGSQSWGSTVNYYLRNKQEERLEVTKDHVKKGNFQKGVGKPTTPIRTRTSNQKRICLVQNRGRKRTLPPRGSTFGKIPRREGLGAAERRSKSARWVKR